MEEMFVVVVQMTNKNNILQYGTVEKSKMASGRLICCPHPLNQILTEAEELKKGFLSLHPSQGHLLLLLLQSVSFFIVLLLLHQVCGIVTRGEV